MDFFQLKNDKLVVSCKDGNELLKSIMQDALENKISPLVDQLASFCERLGHCEGQHTVLQEEISVMRNKWLDHEERLKALERKANLELTDEEFKDQKKGMSNL